MANSFTTEQFVEKLKVRYGSAYDYSHVNYVNVVTPVLIGCPKHGFFEKKPQLLLRGYACNECAKEQRFQVDEGVRKADYATRRVKREQTMMERYGVSNPMHMESTKKKIRETCQTKYGVDNPRQCEAVVEKARATNRERYGADSFAQTPEGLAQIQKTMEERYGSTNFMKSEAAKDVIPIMVEKSRQTQLERYGAEHYAKSDDFRKHFDERKQKENATKLQNGSWVTSQPEILLHEMLEKHFGANDVLCQYSSEDYPFQCDFYIPSRNLYIELNATWTHGHHWFDEYQDKTELEKWLANGSAYYQNAAENWTVRDVVKRQAAMQAQLNYVVFWLADLQDAELWFAMDCPDGQDWRREYSWLPERELTFDGKLTDNLVPTQMSLRAKNYQFNVFFKRELALWKKNGFYKNIPLQAFLYINRYHYLGKIPSELSNMEILRGLRIAGVVKGYTQFDCKLMQQVLADFDIKQIYDPFAGWGERALCADVNQVAYVGRDINFDLLPGYRRMVTEEDMLHTVILFGDSTCALMPEGTDAVLTCPPYFDVEQYTSDGLETKSYDEFLAGWEQIVKQCSDVKYFCFQINQACKYDMVEILKCNGFHLVKSYQFENNKASHFNKKGGSNRKREFEEMLVFEKGKD